MKGYQISQYDLPFCVSGHLDVDDTDARGNVTRTAASALSASTSKRILRGLMHRTRPNGTPYSLMDVNRSGLPLMEIVSAPDIASPEEAQLYLRSCATLLRWIGVHRQYGGRRLQVRRQRIGAA